MSDALVDAIYRSQQEAEDAAVGRVDRRERAQRVEHRDQVAAQLAEHGVDLDADDVRDAVAIVTAWLLRASNQGGKAQLRIVASSLLAAALEARRHALRSHERDEAASGG